ncbi:lysozyme inhibitor LprI family protein [Achromobacter sp.]|uniref:lysozyme inhibitor LprI family protein n=1 Tax=Achromobacter sp. TaxID=134375 RepID=UPI003C76A325
MRPLKPLALCVLALAPLAAAMAADKAQTEQELYEACSGDSQAGMRDCLSRKADESVKALTAAQKEAAEALGKWDEDRQYVDHAKARLAASNQAFPIYRSAQCELSASLSGGAAGNAHEMGKLACLTELNRHRARQLRDAVADLPLK